MKPFGQDTYYDVLNLRPAASTFEIRQSYKALLELYGENSVAAYSLFSESERKNIIADLEEAFSTLINEKSRSDYDQMLVEAGKLDKEALNKATHREPIPIFGIKRSRAPEIGKSKAAPSRQTKPAITPLAKQILAQDVITGSDLAKIRTSLKISLESIAFQTKIRVGLLRFIEEDKFDAFPSMLHLKSFLKSYAQTLNVDTETIVNKYTHRISD